MKKILFILAMCINLVSCTSKETKINSIDNISAEYERKIIEINYELFCLYSDKNLLYAKITDGETRYHEFYVDDLRQTVRIDKIDYINDYYDCIEKIDSIKQIRSEIELDIIQNSIPFSSNVKYTYEKIKEVKNDTYDLDFAKYIK